MRVMCASAISETAFAGALARQSNLLAALRHTKCEGLPRLQRGMLTRPWVGALRPGLYAEEVLLIRRQALLRALLLSCQRSSGIIGDPIRANWYS